jgi:hypothetical protein
LWRSAGIDFLDCPSCCMDVVEDCDYVGYAIEVPTCDRLL